MPNPQTSNDVRPATETSQTHTTHRTRASLASGVDRCVADYAGLAVLTTFAFGVGIGLMLSKPSRPRRPHGLQGYWAASREQAEELADRVVHRLSQAIPAQARRRLHL